MLSEFFKSHARIQTLRDGPGGSLLQSFAQATDEYLEAVDEWIAQGKPDAFRACKTFQDIASAFNYELELDLCPRPGFKKWHLAFGCVTAPSGDAYNRWGCCLPEARQIHGAVAR
jgi:hypothetical protein